ncbi:MAG: class III extradiol ring-cleavage dioxygenase [Thiobacillus sp.]|uniref:DODA-type extradiol aromatic ring-opening family dioxygenase n=1 Tax=Thiobacillus sp. TaxID=924 RepID=UPI0028960F2F|nr:class III extradiol ring-cleavage dioxygenase [Thiobacillus sp.]MDT3707611.1 class III extradiol ring-cleavage dioxygenase [Thiobacillus sp.]
MKRLPTYFLSHGGGPWPWMTGPVREHYRGLEASLQTIARELGSKPRAVLVVSGHWEAAEFSVMASPNPGMIYDYTGFPEHTYAVRYPAPGSPELAGRVQRLLEAAGLAARLDPTRGFDHGCFVPLAVMYPDAGVPVVQLSLKVGYDPETHLAAGRALAPLRDEGVLVVGSGLSYHNLREFGAGAKEASEAFDAWLQESLLRSPPAERSRRLLQWESAPAARRAHPWEDHLIPLMVALGAAEDEPAACVYHEQDFFGGVTVSSFRFGQAAG